MSLALLGNCGFEEAAIPLKGKSEWGLDTLTRKMKGARSLAKAFIATLAQGQAFEGYNLQTWEADDDPQVAIITLNYKGLQTGGTPAPDVRRQVVSAAGQTSKDFSGENDGKGRIYKKVPIWAYHYAAPEPGTGAFADMVVGQRDVYTTGATMEFNYKAMEAEFRYVTIGDLAIPQHSTVETAFTPFPITARIVTSDGAKYGLERMASLELTPVTIDRVVAFESRHVIGTPFYECTDVVRRELGNAP